MIMMTSPKPLASSKNQRHQWLDRRQSFEEWAARGRGRANSPPWEREQQPSPPPYPVRFRGMSSFRMVPATPPSPIPRSNDKSNAKSTTTGRKSGSSSAALLSTGRRRRYARLEQSDCCENLDSSDTSDTESLSSDSDEKDTLKSNKSPCDLGEDVDSPKRDTNNDGSNGNPSDEESNENSDEDLDLDECELTVESSPVRPLQLVLCDSGSEPTIKQPSNQFVGGEQVPNRVHRRKTFGSAANRSAAKPTQSPVVIDPSSSVELEEGHLWGFVEGIARHDKVAYRRLLENGDIHPIPRVGRILELPIFPLEGTWHGKVRQADGALQNRHQILEPFVWEENSASLVFAHESVSELDLTELDKQTTVDPWLNRDLEMEKQAVLFPGHDAACVGSLSVVAFPGFQSSSEAYANSRRVSEEYLGSQHKSKRAVAGKLGTVEHVDSGTPMGWTVLGGFDVQNQRYNLNMYCNDDGKVVAVEVHFLSPQEHFQVASEHSNSAAKLTPRALATLETLEAKPLSSKLPSKRQAKDSPRPSPPSKKSRRFSGSSCKISHKRDVVRLEEKAATTRQDSSNRKSSSRRNKSYPPKDTPPAPSTGKSANVAKRDADVQQSENIHPTSTGKSTSWHKGGHAAPGLRFQEQVAQASVVERKPTRIRDALVDANEGWDSTVEPSYEESVDEAEENPVSDNDEVYFLESEEEDDGIPEVQHRKPFLKSLIEVAENLLFVDSPELCHEEISDLERWEELPQEDDNGFHHLFFGAQGGGEVVSTVPCHPSPLHHYLSVVVVTLLLWAAMALLMRETGLLAILKVGFATSPPLEESTNWLPMRLS